MDYINVTIANPITRGCKILQLPISNDELQKALKELEVEDEYVIGSYFSEVDFLNQHALNKSLTLQQMNLIAMKMSEFTDYDIERTSSYLMAIDATDQNIFEFLGALESCDDLPYYSYDYPGWVDDSDFDNAGKYGCCRANDEGLLDHLRHFNAEGYFDFNEYGRSWDEYIIFTDDGYIIADEDPVDWEYWDEAALLELYEYTDVILSNTTIIAGKDESQLMLEQLLINEEVN